MKIAKRSACRLGTAFGTWTKPAANRPGFTLLEIVLALGLTVLLMAAVYSALDMHWRYSAAGHDEFEKTQLARALLQKMSRDVRSIVYREPEIVSDDDSPEADANERGRTTLTRITSPDEAIAKSGFAILGDSQTLILHVSQASEEFAENSQQQDQPLRASSSDMHVVIWHPSDNGLRRLREFLAGRTTGRHARVYRDYHIAGLIRVETGGLPLDSTNRRIDFELLAAGDTISAPEVRSLRFRYFDGNEWRDEWDSREMEAVPRAIEVTLGFQQSHRTRHAVHHGIVSASTDEYRLVIAMPMSHAPAAAAETSKFSRTQLNGT